LLTALRRTQAKTLLATVHVAIVGCHGNPVYRAVAWIRICVSIAWLPHQNSEQNLLLSYDSKFSETLAVSTSQSIRCQSPDDNTNYNMLPTAAKILGIAGGVH
jgi:dolichyl-phosphate-mannose--protein O-mannosyl transferase